MLHVRRINAAAELDALAGDWDRLSGGVPFRRFAWHCSWWRRFAADRCELYVLVAANDAGEVVGIAPWFLESTVARGRVVR
ncbi:MAG: hypothetical protein KDA41_07050, partial [Planctomycetales bacterium]|nr:hypothetical protein [Planctomycetales bacterium]